MQGSGNQLKNAGNDAGGAVRWTVQLRCDSRRFIRPRRAVSDSRLQQAAARHLVELKVPSGQFRSVGQPALTFEPASECYYVRLSISALLCCSIAKTVYRDVISRHTHHIRKLLVYTPMYACTACSHPRPTTCLGQRSTARYCSSRTTSSGRTCACASTGSRTRPQ